ncbi:hypothetical protein DL96DRAFT_1825360 [Flagelloscypha sp. PMI_526]|nr:hypothetical protein DL96DRAFT_1825360 [Flagelloscypha sp. PMI_526]
MQSLNADGFGAADYDESADRREDTERALLHSTKDAKVVDKVVKVKKSKPANVLPDGVVGLDPADDLEGYYTRTLGETLDGKYHVFSVIGQVMFAVFIKAYVIVADDGTLRPAPISKAAGCFRVRLRRALRRDFWAVEAR